MLASCGNVHNDMIWEPGVETLMVTVFTGTLNEDKGTRDTLILSQLTGAEVVESCTRVRVDVCRGTKTSGARALRVTEDSTSRVTLDLDSVSLSQLSGSEELDNGRPSLGKADRLCSGGPIETMGVPPRTDVGEKKAMSIDSITLPQLSGAEAVGS